MNQSLVNSVVLAACGLVWLIALVVGLWRVRHRRDRRGLIVAVLALVALLFVVVFTTGTKYGAEVVAALRERMTGPPAVLVTSWQGEGELEYRLGSRELSSRSTDGRYTVQAGTLRLSSFTARAGTGENVWEARTMLYEAPSLTVTGGQEQPLEVGPPYTAKVESEKQFNRLSLKVTDVGGHSTNLSDADRSDAPGLEVLNKQGKVVWQGKFAYG